MFCWPRTFFLRDECFPELLLEVFRVLAELLPEELVEEVGFLWDEVEVDFLAVAGFAVVALAVS